MNHFVIIGGTSGIGRGIAERLTREGNSVTTISRRQTGLHGCEHLSLDVTTDTIPTERFEALRGIAYCPGSITLKPFKSLSPDVFQEDWNINVLGAVRSLQALISRLDKTNGASILFMSTVAVQQGLSFHASVAAAKGAVEGLTRSLAAELAPRVRVNCIAPSLTDTSMSERLLANDARRQANSERHPLKRVGTIDDISSMGHFLLTDSSSWITGQVIGVDGGMGAIKMTA